MTSSCGVCGKASLDALHVRGCSKIEDKIRVESEMIRKMLDALRGAQAVFNRTGGLHASGLFNSEGKLLSLREDVGRHNALDKLIGSQLLAGSIPLRERILAVSGRSSFEIIQKSLVASIPVIVAVGAPSSLAVELARDFDVTLIGFAREDSFNIYSGRERILLPTNVPKADLSE
jgi:FdhD protein